MRPKVSIITMVYNHERFLRQSLDSVLMQQTDFDYELIVGEDCSPDGSREILKEYESKFVQRMVPLYRRKNLGMARNLLDCLSRCRGDYIAMLEGDDFWTDPQKLQKQVDFLDSHPDYSAVYHNYTQVDIRGENPRRMQERDCIYTFTVADLEAWELPAQTGTLMFRREIEIPKWLLLYAWIPQDRTCMLLFLRNGKVAVLPDCMSAYRVYAEQGGTNWSSQHEHFNKNEELLRFAICRTLERMGRHMGLEVDLFRCRREIMQRLWEKREAKQFGKGRETGMKLVMALAEPQKLRLMKELTHMRFGWGDDSWIR